MCTRSVWVCGLHGDEAKNQLAKLDLALAMQLCPLTCIASLKVHQIVEVTIMLTFLHNNNNYKSGCMSFLVRSMTCLLLQTLCNLQYKPCMHLANCTGFLLKLTQVTL